MRRIGKKLFLSAFCLLITVGFLVLPLMAKGESVDISPLDAINLEDKIKLNEWDRVVLIRSLVPKFNEKWMNASNLEEEAILTLLQAGAKGTFADYLFLKVPVNVGRVVFTAIYKIACAIITKDPSIIIGELEKMSVSQANQYISDWLFQNELRVSSGNLKGQYPSCEGNKLWRNFVFPYIVVCRPMDSLQGKVSMEIYSSKTIDSPEAVVSPFPSLDFEWEGGICKIPPFMVKINGISRKVWAGAGFYYEWASGPKIDIIFGEPVPDFTVKEMGVIETQINNINDWIKETGLTIDKIAEKLIDFLGKTKGQTGSIVNSLTPFLQLNEVKDITGASPVASTGDAPVMSSLANEENGNGGGTKQISPDDMQEIIDDISEKIDILIQEVAELVGESQGGVGQELAIDGSREGEETNATDIVENNNGQNQLAEQAGSQILLASTQATNLSIGGGSAPVAIIYPKILISEIQTAGLESEKDEFVELFNPNNEEIDLTGWYLQKKTKLAENFLSFASGNLFDNKKIAGNGYFLIARSGSVFAGIADILIDNSLADNNSLALKNPNKEIVDKVGWGNANDFETAPTENPGDSQSIGREWSATDANYFDTDNNFNDFKIQIPTPKVKNTSLLAGGEITEEEIPPVIPDEQGEEENNGSDGQNENPLEIKKILINEIQIANNEFMELFNPNDSDVDISDWYFSYFSSGREWNNPWRNKKFSEILSTVIIPAQKYFLIGLKEYPTENGNPNSDAQIYPSGLFNNNSGAVGIFSCNPDISADDSVGLEKVIEKAKSCKVDLVGWGNTNVKEGEAVALFSTDESLTRIKDNETQQYQDTDNNLEDFEISVPSPTNSKGETIMAPIVSDPVLPDDSAPIVAVSDWQTFQGNNQRTGRANAVGIKSGTLNEIADLGLFDQNKIATISQPIIRSDGVVFYGAGETGNEGIGGWGKVCAFNKDKTLKWEQADLGSPAVAISMSADGSRIYISSYSSGLIVLDAETGAEKWRYPIDDMSLISGVAQDETGNIYFTNNSDIDKFYSLNADGIENWSPKEGGPKGGSPLAGPAVGQDGSVFVAWIGFRGSGLQDGEKGLLRAYSSDGKLKWQTDLDYDASGPVVGNDGNVYVVSGVSTSMGTGRMLDIFNSKDGTLISQSNLDFGKMFNPVNNQDGTIAIADSWSIIGGEVGGYYYYYPRSDLKIFDLQGNIIWQTDIEENVSIDNQPIADSEGNIFLAKTIYKQQEDGPGVIPDSCRLDIVSPNIGHNIDSVPILQGMFNGSLSVSQNGYVYFALSSTKGEGIIGLKLYSLEP